MSYDKYKKIKGSPSKTSPNSGIKNADNYVDDNEKTLDQTSVDYDRERAVSSLGALDVYAENDMKTVNPDDLKHLVSVLNCSSTNNFVKECRAAEKLYHSRKSEHLNPGQIANEGYHIISSCRGRNIDPLLVHQAGIDLAHELCGDDFAAKICTHLNTNNYHNHIIINAYAIDGSHKFKDEYHLYKKIRRISNEISLQYGFDIIMPGLTDKRNWAEYLDGRSGYEEIKSILKNVKQDIRECAANASDYAAYETAMASLGYQLAKSRKRITYIKDGIAISDHRLGSRYSKEGIEEAIRKNLDTKHKKQASVAITCAIKKQELRSSRLPDLSNIYVPCFNKKGQRIPAIIRFLMLIRKYIERIGDTFFDAAASEMFPNNSRMENAAKKIKRLDTAIELCEKYDIRTIEGLSQALREAGMEAKTSDYEAIHLYETADRMVETVEALKIRGELAAYIKQIGLDDSYFISPPLSPENLKKNWAALDPMLGKQKKQLWNALNASNYRLRDGKFSFLTRSDAKEILSFLNGKSQQMPDSLIYYDPVHCDTVLKDLDHTQASAKSSKTPSSKKKSINMKSYHEDDRLCILEYKKIMDAINGYGLDTEEKVDSFIQSYETVLAQADALSARSRAQSEVYKELTFISNTLKNAASKSFIYGPLYPGRAEALDAANTVISDNTADQLIELQAQLTKALETLSEIPLTPTTIQDISFSPLPPEIRELIDRLRIIFPKHFTVKPAPKTEHFSSLEAYQLLSSFKNDNIIYQAIRELEYQESEKKKEPETYQSSKAKEAFF